MHISRTKCIFETTNTCIVVYSDKIELFRKISAGIGTLIIKGLLENKDKILYRYFLDYNHIRFVLSNTRFEKSLKKQKSIRMSSIPNKMFFLEARRPWSLDCTAAAFLLNHYFPRIKTFTVHRCRGRLRDQLIGRNKEWKRFTFQLISLAWWGKPKTLYKKTVQHNVDDDILTKQCFPRALR